MKITRVDTTPAPGASALVRLRTDEGITGVGQAGAAHAVVAEVVAAAIEPLLVGQDPLLISRDAAMIGEVWEALHGAARGRAGAAEAVGGTDIALWDLLGKLTGQPLRRLLGTARLSARACVAVSGGHEAEAAVAHGATAVKVRVGGDVVADIALVTGIGAAVGSEVDIVVDGAGGYDRLDALRMARALEDVRVAWFEEPVRARNLTEYNAEHAWLAERVAIPLAGGKRLRTRYEFLEPLSRHAFDVLRPDCTVVGGISEARKVAAMAAAWGIRCAPYSAGSPIAHSAALHVALSTPGAEPIEPGAPGTAPVQTTVRAGDGLGLGLPAASPVSRGMAVRVMV